MTQQTKSTLDTVVKYVNLLAIIGLIFAMGQWKQDAESRMFDNQEQKQQTIEHKNSIDPHRTYQDNTDLFVTRREYVNDILYIKEALQKLEIQKNKQTVKDWASN